MIEPDKRIICRECGWRGTFAKLLRAAHPFQQGETTYGCPECREADLFSVACDEPGCWEPAIRGTPTPTGYRNTCSGHAPETEE